MQNSFSTTCPLLHRLTVHRQSLGYPEGVYSDVASTTGCDRERHDPIMETLHSQLLRQGDLITEKNTLEPQYE